MTSGERRDVRGHKEARLQTYVDSADEIDLRTPSTNKLKGIVPRNNRKLPKVLSSSSQWTVPVLWMTVICLYFGQFHQFHSMTRQLDTLFQILEAQEGDEGIKFPPKHSSTASPARPDSANQLQTLPKFSKESTVSPGPSKIVNTAATPLRIGILSTYPPQACGIGQFAMEMYHCLVSLPSPPNVKVLVVDSKGSSIPHLPEVAIVIRKEEQGDYIKAADYANHHFDLLLCEHEFGIFGGQYGDLLFTLVKRLSIPVVYTFHTIFDIPPAHFHSHLKEVLDTASQVIVILPSACDKLKTVKPALRCTHVPHGIEALAPGGNTVQRKYKSLIKGRRIILSAGLISPSKGLEFMLEGLHQVIKAVPNVLYLIIGEQHPGLRFPYSQTLVETVKKASLSKHVSFITEFQEKAMLLEWFSLAEVVVVPHLDMEQVSSGTLTMSMGVGTAAVSTEFHYAKFMCNPPSGMVACLTVPPRDPAALSEAVLRLLLDDKLRTGIRKAAWKETRSMTWPKIAEETIRICQEARLAPSLGTLNQKAQSFSVRAWKVLPRQEQLARGLAALRHADVAAQALAIEDFVPALLAPQEGSQVSHQLAARTTQALSFEGLLFSRWLPANNAPNVRVDSDGKFMASNGLLVLHGDLAAGVVFHSAPSNGRIIGLGVLYSGAFVRFSHNDERHDISIQANVKSWGHRDGREGAVIWFLSKVITKSGTLVGTCNFSHSIQGGSQELGLTVDFKALPGLELRDIELVVGMDYLSKLHHNLAFDRFVGYTYDGDLDVRDGQTSDGDLYRRYEDDKLKWILLKSFAAELGIFVLFSNASHLNQISHSGAERGNFHYVTSIYQSSTLKDQRFTVHERKFVLSNVFMRKLNDYDSVFHNTKDLMGVDLSYPSKGNEVIAAMGMFQYHLPTDLEQYKELTGWLEKHGVFS